MGNNNIRYPGLIEYIVANYVKRGKKPREMYKEVVQKFNYDKSIKSFSAYCSQVKRGVTGSSISGIPDKRNKKTKKNRKNNKQQPKITTEEKFLTLIKKHKSLSIIDVCNSLNCPPFKIDQTINQLRSRGMEVSSFDGMVSLNVDVIPNVEKVNPLSDVNEIVFGVASDLHFGSKSCQITALKEFCYLCEKEGVQHILSPGDIFTGTNVYPGHNYDVYALSAEEQEQSCVLNLPTGFQWYMLGGNHDYTFIKRGGGHNPVLAVSNMRDDIHYVGFDEADVPILPGVDAKLWHPSGGVPYSISYRLQKGIEQVAYNELSKIMKDVKEKPTVRFVLSGHLHIQMQALFGSIFGCQSGCFEGQTDYLKRKGLFPAIGGYIIKASLGKDGLLKSFEAKFHMFDEIIDDYKNYNHEQKIKSTITGPIFSPKK